MRVQKETSRLRTVAYPRIMLSGRKVRGEWVRGHRQKIGKGGKSGRRREKLCGGRRNLPSTSVADAYISALTGAPPSAGHVDDKLGTIW